MDVKEWMPDNKIHGSSAAHLEGCDRYPALWVWCRMHNQRMVTFLNGFDWQKWLPTALSMKLVESGAHCVSGLQALEVGRGARW